MYNSKKLIPGWVPLPLVVGVLSILVSLILAELLLQLVAARPLRILTNLSDQELSALGPIPRVISAEFSQAAMADKWHLPNSDWRWAGQPDRAAEFVIKGHWNNMACHDTLDYRNDPAKTNILFLGDSFVEAVQVLDDETFFARFRAKLGNENLNVMGCGWSGWSPAYAYSNLAQLEKPPNDLPAGGRFPGLRELAPQHIFYLVYLGNDLRNEAPGEFEALNKAKIGCNSLQELSKNSGPFILINRFLSFYYMYLYRGKRNPLCADDTMWPYLDLESPAVRAGFDAMERSIIALKRESDSLGASLSIGLIEPFPVPYGAKSFEEAMRYNYFDAAELDYDLTAPANRLGRFLDEHGIPYLDFSEVFASDPAHDHYYLSDLHLNKKGHAAIAQALIANRGRLFHLPADSKQAALSQREP